MFHQAMLELVTGKKSGVLYLKTADNHSASIHLKTGDIVGINYRVRRGAKAIDLIKSADIDSYRFDPDGLLVDMGGLPTTKQILQALAGEALGLKEEAPTVENTAPAPAQKTRVGILSRKKPAPVASKPSATQATAFVMPESAYSNIEEMLLQFLAHELGSVDGGDIAMVHKAIVKADALNGKVNLSQAIQLIARDIGDPEKASAFHNKLAPWSDLISGPRALDLVNRAFTEFMGPMAELIAGDHVKKLGGRISNLNQLHALIMRLSKELGGKVEALRFIKLCYSTLFSFK